MAGGFNRQDFGRGMDGRGNANPWGRRPVQGNNYLPLHNPPPSMPHPPPPPSFRFHEIETRTVSTSFRQNLSRNPYEGNGSFQDKDIPYDHGRWNNGSESVVNRDRYFDTHHHSSSNFNRDGREENNRYDNERTQRRFERRGEKYHHRSQYDEDRRKIHDRRNQDYQNRNDISSTQTSPDRPSNARLGSPDVIEVPVQPNSSILFNSSGIEKPSQSSVSKLEQAYMRRLSQNSDSSDISVIPINSSALVESEKVKNHPRLPNHYSKSHNTPTSPDR